MPVHRAPWGKFPALSVHAALATVHSHPSFAAATAGNAGAAADLVAAFFSPDQLPNLPQAHVDCVVPLPALSAEGTLSALPLALAQATAAALHVPVHAGITQTSRFPPSAPTSITRLTNQPTFAGRAPHGACVIVAAHVGYGTALANLRGFLHHHGCTVAFASALCADFTAARVAPDPFTIRAITQRFGPHTAFLTETLGFAPALLTNREALLLYSLPNLNSLRDPTLPTHSNFGPPA